MVVACAVSAFLAYYSGELFGDDVRNTQLVQRMAKLKFVVLTRGAFLQTVSRGTTTRYHGRCIRQACEKRDMLVPLNKRY